MPSNFTSHFREYIASAILNYIQTSKRPAWKSNTSYVTGAGIVVGSRMYVCAASGVSGIVTPVHSSGIASDGGVSWIYTGATASSRLFSGNLYLGIGKLANWASPSSPDAVISNDLVEADAKSNLISLKSVSGSNANVVIPRHNWVTATVYEQYSDVIDPSDYTGAYYVQNSSNLIYKCIDNNDGATSTNEPTGSSSSTFRTADGYVWKYMATVDSSLLTNFMTTDFTPVKVAASVSDGAAQWATQNAATSYGISTFAIAKQSGTFAGTPLVSIETSSGSGAAATATKTGGNTIKQVYVTAPGNSYAKQDTYAIVTNGALGGTGATATATISGGVITGFVVNTNGSGYTSGAIALVVGVGVEGQTLVEATGISVTVVANAVTAITRATGGSQYASATVYIIPGTAGAVAFPVMAPPTGHGKNIIRELNAHTVMVNIALTGTESSYFLTGVGSDFHQISLVLDPLVYGALGEIATAERYIGPAHPSYASPGGLLKIAADSGTVIYLDNAQTVVRASNQIETIKVTVTL